MAIVKCEACGGDGTQTGDQYSQCTGCQGKGWIEDEEPEQSEQVETKPAPTPPQPSIDEDEYLRLKHLHDSIMGTDDDEDNWQYWRSIVNPYS